MFIFRLPNSVNSFSITIKKEKKINKIRKLENKIKHIVYMYMMLHIVENFLFSYHKKFI